MNKVRHGKNTLERAATRREDLIQNDPQNITLPAISRDESHNRLDEMAEVKVKKIFFLTAKERSPGCPSFVTAFILFVKRI
jgi:hypothetical protein